jgi:branched-chain amino acid transport system substrate-binding protein
MTPVRQLALKLSALAVAAGLSASALAQEIRIGLTGTFTGPNASVGIPYRNTAEIYPPTLGGLPARWIVLDDGGDPTAGIKNARRFVDEDKVDAIVGSTSTPVATAMFDIANESRTLQIAMAPVAIPAGKAAWLFNIPQPVPLMVSAIVDDMKRRGIKTAAYIGYADGWGDLNWNGFSKLAADASRQHQRPRLQGPRLSHARRGGGRVHSVGWQGGGRRADAHGPDGGHTRSARVQPDSQGLH